MQNLIYENMFLMLYERSLLIVDEINEKYPSFKNDIKNFSTTQNFKQNYPNATENEIVAHAFATMVLLYVMFGIPNHNSHPQE